MYAACFLITSAVLGVDYGYQVTDQGQLEYVVQIEPEAIESLKAGQPIQVGLPPDSERIQVFRVQVGNDELSKVVPASYQKPVKAVDGEIKLFPANDAVLTAPPDPESIADTKPSLGEAVADYGPRSTKELPYGATSTSGTGNTGSGTSAAGTSSSSYGEIPGAAARYGGGTSSNFSVPAPPGSTSSYGAAQTSATTPVTGSPSGTSTTNNSQYSGSSTAGTSGTTSGTTAGGTSTSGNRYSSWNSSNPTAGSNTGSTTGNTANSTTSGSTAGTGTNQFRFNNQQPGTTSGSNLVEPSNPSSGWRNEVSTDLGGGTSPGQGYGNPSSPNNGASQNNQSGNNAAPPLMTGGGNYSGNNTQQPPSDTPQNNGTNGQNSDWLANTWNNNQGNSSQQPPTNQTPPPPQNPQGQYGQNPNPPNYGNPSPPNYNNGNYNNGYVNNNVPYSQQQGQYNNLGQYNPNVPAGYNQVPPYLSNSQIDYVAALARLNGAQSQNGSPSAPLANSTSSRSDKDEEEPAKNAPVETEIVREPPDWWQLLAVGFLISICLNGYMFMTSQDFRRKYQDLLEDVRDLRTLSND